MTVDDKKHHAARLAAVWLIGAPILVALVYLAALEWRAERLLDELRAGISPQRTIAVPPLMEGPWRTLARALASAPAPDLDAAESAIDKALALRPLYAPAWLELAEIERSRGNRDAAIAHAAHARRLWPAHAGLAWATVNLHVKSGDTAGALTALRDYWRLQPQQTRRVLSLAAILEPDSARLYRAVVPQAPATGLEPDHYPNQFQDHARRAGDPVMALAGWRAAPESYRRDGDNALRFIDFMLARRNIAPALDAWRDLTGDDASERLHNPGFEDPLTEGGFGWRLHDIEGAATAVVADPHTGSRALRVTFDGSTNVNYAHARQTIAIAPAASYRLEGRWRADDITTRSGVFLDIRTLDAEKNTYARNEPRYKSWEWQPFTIEWTTPVDATLAELRVRRAPTDALDSKIAGTLWLDDLALYRLDDRGSKIPSANAAPDSRIGVHKSHVQSTGSRDQDPGIERQWIVLRSSAPRHPRSTMPGT